MKKEQGYGPINEGRQNSRSVIDVLHGRAPCSVTVKLMVSVITRTTNYRGD